MDGRFSKCMLFVLTNCKDPAHDAQFNEWYNHTHLPDIVNSGLFQHPVRWVKANDTPDSEEPRYLATYESDSDDPARLMEELSKLGGRLTAQGRMLDTLEVVFAGMFQRIEGSFWTHREQPKSHSVVMNNNDCSDPTREDDFNYWLSHIQLTQPLGTGLFHTASRYRDINPPAPDRGKYLQVYESDIDPLKALEEFDANRAAAPPDPTRPDMAIFRAVSRRPYRRIYPAI